MPYGKTLKQHLGEFIAIFSKFIQCKTSSQSPPVKIVRTQLVSGTEAAPLDMLALASMLIAAAMLVGISLEALLPFIRRRFVERDPIPSDDLGVEVRRSV